MASGCHFTIRLSSSPLGGAFALGQEIPSEADETLFDCHCLLSVVLCQCLMCRIERGWTLCAGEEGELRNEQDGKEYEA